MYTVEQQGIMKRDIAVLNHHWIYSTVKGSRKKSSSTNGHAIKKGGGGGKGRTNKKKKLFL